jgi:futalosine hydrolase
VYPHDGSSISGSISESAPLVSMLLIVPTQFELQFLSSSFREQINETDCRMELCGFGIVVSALRTSQLIARYSPKRVLLIGIAGTLNSRFPIGHAFQFSEVECFGIGAGAGDHYVSAHEMDWRQWPQEPEISGSILLTERSGDNLANQTATLLTCCSASATDQDVQWKLKKHPKAVAEDMEGFAVAAACRFAGIPLTIVRGISNRAGDRNKENWRVAEAMLAVEKTIPKVLSL